MPSSFPALSPTRCHAWLLTTLLVLLLAACGSQGTTEVLEPDVPDAPIEPIITVEPDALTVLRGDAGTATVSVGEGFEGPVTLTVTGAPDGVDASVQRTEVDPGGTATLTISAGGSAAEATSTLTISAEAGEASATTRLDLTVVALEVEGRVTDGHGAGIEGLSVSVEGETITTGPDGSFSFDGVTVPYDLTVFDVGEAWLQQLQGLRTATPTVSAYERVPLGGPAATEHAIMVSGTLSEAVGANQVTHVCVKSDERPTTGCTAVDPSGETFSTAVRWNGESTLDATVYAVVYELGADGVATGIAAMGSTSISLAEGTDESDVAVTLEPVDARLIDVEVDSPTGVASLGVGALTTLAGVHGALSAPLSSASAPFTAPVPDLPGADHLIFAGWLGGAQVIAWAHADGSESTISFAPRQPPALVRPSGDAAGIGVGSTLQIDAEEGMRHVHVLQPPAGAVSVMIATTNQEARLPDVAAFDPSFEYVAGTYYWNVISTDTEWDDGGLANEGGSPIEIYESFSRASAGWGSGPSGTGTLYISPERELVID